MNENVRLDYLKIQRKLYNNYPPDSKERRLFLKTIKLSALSQLISEASQVSEKSISSTVVFYEKFILKDLLFISILASSLLCSFFVYSFSLSFFMMSVFILCQIGLVVLLILRIQHVLALFKSRDITIKYPLMLRNKIEQLRDEINELGDATL